MRDIYPWHTHTLDSYISCSLRVSQICVGGDQHICGGQHFLIRKKIPLRIYTLYTYACKNHTRTINKSQIQIVMRANTHAIDCFIFILKKTYYNTAVFSRGSIVWNDVMNIQFNLYLKECFRNMTHDIFWNRLKSMWNVITMLFVWLTTLRTSCEKKVR